MVRLRTMRGTNWYPLPLGRRMFSAARRWLLQKVSLRRMLGGMPHANRALLGREEFQKAFHASACLGNLAKQGFIECVEAETFELERRMADIVLSASDEDDLRQAMGAALTQYELSPEVQQSVPPLLSYLKDDGTPLEIRQLLLDIMFGLIAESVAFVTAQEGRRVDAWINAALFGYVSLGKFANFKLQNLSEEDWIIFAERYQARENQISEWHRQAVESGQDVFCPFGNPDD